MQQVATKSDMRKMEARLQGELSAMRAELVGEMSAMRAELVGELSEMNGKLNILLWAMPMAMVLVVVVARL